MLYSEGERKEKNRGDARSFSSPPEAPKMSNPELFFFPSICFWLRSVPVLSPSVWVTASCEKPVAVVGCVGVGCGRGRPRLLAKAPLTSPQPRQCLTGRGEGKREDREAAPAFSTSWWPGVEGSCSRNPKSAPAVLSHRLISRPSVRNFLFRSFALPGPPPPLGGGRAGLSVGAGRRHQSVSWFLAYRVSLCPLA